MAIIRLAQPFDAFHGTIADVVGGGKLVLFSTPKSAGVSRQWVVPANPESIGQIRIRAYLRVTTRAYKALAPEQAALWDAAAERINQDNILHLSHSLSGVNLFVTINVYRLVDWQLLAYDVPAIVQPPIPTKVTRAYVSPATNLRISGNCPGAHVGQRMMARVSRPLPSAARKARKNDVRLLGSWHECITAVDIKTVSFNITITAGDYVAGDRVGVELTPLSSAYFPGRKFMEPNIGVTE